MKYLIFILLLLKLSTGFSQIDYNIPKIYFDSLITESRVGGINLGDDFIDLINRYDFIEDYNEFYLKINDKLILSIWTQDQKTISGITVYSSEFKTKDNLHVGLEISNVLKIYPNLKINLSEETTEEYFSIGKYFETNDNAFLIYLTSSTGKKLGQYNSIDFGPKSDNFEKEGRIEKIEIFK